MRKNILIIILGLFIIYLFYSNLTVSKKNNELELELASKVDEIESLKKELVRKEEQINAMKKLAEIWNARALSSGYDPTDK